MTKNPARGGRIALRHLVFVTAAALLLALWRFVAADPFTDALEDRLLDLRFKLRGARPAPPEIVLVAIDEPTLDRLGWAPPPRDRIAQAILRILDGEPSVLALDLLFLDRTDADAALSGALATSQGVVLGTAIGSLSGPGREHSPELRAALDRSAIAVVVDPPALSRAPPRLLAPASAVLAQSTLAHVNIVQSADRVARRVPLSLWIGEDRFLPALALEVARRHAGLGRGAVVLRPGESLSLGDNAIATDRAGAITIAHYGGSGAIRTVSLLDLLEGGLPPDMFTGRAVILGATAESLSDLFATPFGADVAGAEILATMTANLIAGDLVIRDGRTAAISLVLASLLAALIFAAARLRMLTAAVAASITAWIVGAGALQLAFTAAGLWLDATAVLGALIAATIWCAHQRLRAERALAEDLSEERVNLARYVSPLLADDLARSDVPEFDRRTQNATVLFVDVAGYTTLAEQMTPADTAAMLRGLHRFFERCASDHRGVIVSFEGDGAMIAFGLPEPADDDAARALECGRALVDGAADVAVPAVPDARLRLRVSIHHGPVTAAILGGARQAQVTLTGDTVNVASRLQETAKAHGASMVASRATLDAASAGGAAPRGFTPLVTQTVRGRTGQIEVWEADSGLMGSGA